MSQGGRRCARRPISCRPTRRSARLGSNVLPRDVAPIREAPRLFRFDGARLKTLTAHSSSAFQTIRRIDAPRVVLAGERANLIAGEDDNAHSARVAPKRQELAQIERQPGYHVRTGEARHRRRRGNEQKMVDVQFAVDALLMASRGLFQSCTLLTGDLDFKPLVSALVEMGVDVQLLYPKGETNDDLKAAADSAAPPTIAVCQSWISDASPTPALPHAGLNFQGPRAMVAHSVEWQDDRYGQCFVERHDNAFQLITERSPQNPLTHRLEMSASDPVVLRTYAEDVFDLIVPAW